MADTNIVVLAGRLTRDSELKYTANGQAVCKFSLALNRRKKQGEEWVDEANFFDVVLWGRLGESLNQYLIKGKSVVVTGGLRQERWEKDGANRSRVEVVADNVQLMSSGQSQGGGYSYSGSPAPAQGQASYGAGNTAGQQAPSQESPDDGFADDIPF